MTRASRGLTISPEKRAVKRKRLGSSRSKRRRCPRHRVERARQTACVQLSSGGALSARRDGARAAEFGVSNLWTTVSSHWCAKKLIPSAPGCLAWPGLGCWAAQIDDRPGTISSLKPIERRTSSWRSEDAEASEQRDTYKGRIHTKAGSLHTKQGAKQLRLLHSIKK